MILDERLEFADAEDLLHHQPGAPRQALGSLRRPLLQLGAQSLAVPRRVTQAIDVVGAMRTEIAKAMVGQDAVIEQVIAALLAAGHPVVPVKPNAIKTWRESETGCIPLRRRRSGALD